MILAVPLGDIVNRRRLILAMVFLEAVALGFVALSGTPTTFALASFAIGAAAAVAYVIIPYAASLESGDRGRNVGLIMVGSLLSIPIAWVVAGGLGGLLGWRFVYLADAMLLLVLIALTGWAIKPDLKPAGGLRSWPALLARVENISLRQIARRVGVSAPAVYHHFPDKASLLAALARVGLAQLEAAAAAALDTAGGGQEGFFATGRAYVEFAVADAYLPNGEAASIRQRSISTMK